ncbi:hypothetical protein TrCOL_g3194 [Triparma columacea]|uniref:Uncharacterized protein n=1 Tax=Triparma columacea TaxID=722753 RepID=A0A9W7GBR8_9STRA|nr:hypothetical protein TrCOL_g3194 [Triparma columacea]
MSSSWEADFPDHQSGLHSSSSAKQEITFKTGLEPVVAEVLGEGNRGGSAAEGVRTIEEADKELNISSKPPPTFFDRALSLSIGNRKFDKKGRANGRSNSVPPPRRRGSSGGVGELKSKPSPTGSLGSSKDIFGTSPRASIDTTGFGSSPPGSDTGIPDTVGGGGILNLPEPSQPNYAQRNTASETLTFKPPSVPSMAEDDDYDDFVLEVKCLDTGKVETVNKETKGLAGISWEERKRIRGSIVLGEKLLMEKIALFKKGVSEKRSFIKSSMTRRTTWGGGGGSNRTSRSNSGGGGNKGGTSRINGGGSVGVEGSEGNGGKVVETKEMTFALRSTPYSAADGGME